MDTITLSLAKKYTKTSIAGLWDKWNTSTTYAAGQIVLYNSIPYQKKSGASTQGTFVPAEWEQINISDELEKIALKENLSNKVTSMSASSTDTEYPSAKCVFDAINAPGIVYGFHIDGGNSSPSAAVTYIEDAVGMTPAYMNYTSGTFNYGSWQNAFFMPKPCMLKTDGTVDYYLNPNDYTKKSDGTASDVASTSYDGNAMMEWGQNGKKIWYKIVPDSDTKSGSVYIADYQVDSGYNAWSFINNQGNMVDHFYTPIYNGSLVSDKMRSISGQACMNSKNASQEITYATANNATSNVLWYTEVFADIQLINFLLILMGKSLDTQSVFGNGHYTGGSSASSLLVSGTMNDKGMFYGTNGTGVGVKVFGMENWWGNQWRRYAGHINASGTQKIKLTYGMQDGSTINGYNTDGSGYLSIGATPSGSSGGYISAMAFGEKSMLPQVASGSQTTYYCDGLWFNNGQTDYAYRGGGCGSGWTVGTFSCALGSPASGANWSIGSSLSCKPLA